MQVRECLLPFGVESSVFQFASQKYRDQDTLNCNFACSFVWVCSFISTLRKEHGLRVFKNRVLRKIFRPKTGQRKGEWKRLHNERIYDLYFSPHIQVIKSRMRGERHVAQESYIQGFGWET